MTYNNASKKYHIFGIRNLAFFISCYLSFPIITSIKNFIDVISPIIKIRISEECVLRNMHNIVILIIDMNLNSTKIVFVYSL